MARLQSQSTLLYYPTPVSIAETLATWFTAPNRTRIADPCCGTGEALVHFSQGFNTERIGVELSYSRAAQAEKVLDRVLPTSFYTATWSVQSVGLILNNCPYDWSQFSETINGHSRSIRHEVLFIERAKEKIVVGGHHIIIVPRAILGDSHSLGNGQEARIARHLLGWYEQVIVYRFPDGEYERFKQVVVLACKRRAKYATPTREDTEAIVRLADESAEIQPLPEGDGRYIIPAVSGQYVFKFTAREPKDEVRVMRRCNPTATPEYKRATYIRPVGEAFNPIESIKVGHVTLLISGNDVGAVKLSGDDGQSMLVKGTSVKVVEKSIITKIDEDGDEHDDVTAVDKYIPTWTVTNQDGHVDVLTDVTRIARLAERYARELADAVQVRNTPLYGNNPTPTEWAQTARIGVNMPALPGRTERGLFERQRHWAIALQRAMRTRKHAIANLGMGTGKTVITIGALNTLGKFPAVVVVPAHMPAEWIKTAILGSDPESPIKPMWITRPTREAQEISGTTLDFSKLMSPLFHPQYQPGWITGWNTNTTKWASLRNAIEDIGGTVMDSVRWHDEKDDEVRRWRKVEVKCDLAQATQIASLVSRTLAVRTKTFTYRPEIQFSTDGLTCTYFDADDYTLFDFEQDWKAGKLGKKAIAIVSIETAKYDAGDLEGFRLPRKNFFGQDEETGETLRRASSICPHCGQVVKAGWRFCQNKLRDQKLGEPVLNEAGKVVSYKLLPFPEKDDCLPACGAALFQFSRYRRTGGARLIQHKLRGLFKLYVADELHKFKSLDSDAGAADQRLISATKYSLGLTGTLFGGSSSSIFPILYRRVPEVRAQFAFEDVTRWVDVYGIWEKKWKENKANLTGLGANTGLKRWGYRSRELPGVSPAVIRYLLPLCVFGQVTDLGYELPPFSDVVEAIPMTDEMAEQYNQGKEAILQDAMALLKEYHDPGGLSVWFNFCRFRANSMFRPEEVGYSGKLGGGFAYALEAVSTVGDLLPKEKRLAEIIAENARRGRKTLVFAEQTGSRDIRSRMKRAIESAQIGRPLNIEILSASDMAPAQRMAWIRANAPKIDALIVNPKLVETGLTLTMFSDIVFYEVTPSLYVIWQSMRRVWRLSQSRDVVTHFLAYAETVEIDILNRMGRKMRYASMLYGDSAASVLESSDGDESIQDEIIRAALSGVLTVEKEQVKHLFSTGNERVVAMSTEITGSLVASTPALPTSPSWDDWKKIRGAVLFNSRRKSKDTAPTGQLSLGF